MHPFSHFRIYQVRGALLVVGVCTALLVGASVYVWSRFDSPLPQNPTQEQAAYWKHELGLVGATSTYEKFRDFYTTHDTKNSHALAHIIGQLIYDDVGPAALMICDDAFSYGCYHQVMLSALKDQGLGILPKLSSICERAIIDQRAGECFHGIGHGLVEYFGINQLEQALELCGPVAGEHSKRCRRGAFMDYMVPLEKNGSSLIGVAPRAIDTHKPYALCESARIRSEYLNDCYFTLPHVWYLLPTIKGRTVPELCGALETPLYRNACAGGMGIDLPGTVSYDQHTIIEACNAVGHAEATRRCLQTSHGVLISLGHDACIIGKLLLRDGQAAQPCSTDPE